VSTEKFPDGEPAVAALAYITLALQQQVRPDAHKMAVLPPYTSYYWPEGWTWEPAETVQENLAKARFLLDIQMAEPGQEPLDPRYPSQGEVNDWQAANFDVLDEAWTTLGLVEEVGEFCRALLKRRQGIRGSFQEWTTEAQKEMGDIFIKLLDVAGNMGFDLSTVVSKRWAIVGKRDFRANPQGHGLPDEGAA
jgi:NTP pyrophosphatase (non-canonical NTP hydrolase)